MARVVLLWKCVYESKILNPQIMIMRIGKVNFQGNRWWTWPGVFSSLSYSHDSWISTKSGKNPLRRKWGRGTNEENVVSICHGFSLLIYLWGSKQLPFQSFIPCFLSLVLILWHPEPNNIPASWVDLFHAVIWLVLSQWMRPVLRQSFAVHYRCFLMRCNFLFY